MGRSWDFIPACREALGRLGSVLSYLESCVLFFIFCVVSISLVAATWQAAVAFSGRRRQLGPVRAKSVRCAQGWRWGALSDRKVERTDVGSCVLSLGHLLWSRGSTCHFLGPNRPCSPSGSVMAQTVCRPPKNAYWHPNPQDLRM